MKKDEKGNPLTYWGGLEKAIKITLEEAIENKIKGEIVETVSIIERSYSEEEVMEMFHNLSMHLPLHYEFLVKEQFKKK